jgi:hypothetical protein
MIDWLVSKEDSDVIHAIAERAVDKFGFELLSIEMDVTACHANGNPLFLKELLMANDFEFVHDILGIRKHIDRKTGKLDGLFSPRFSQWSNKI